MSVSRDLGALGEAIVRRSILASISIIMALAGGTQLAAAQEPRDYIECSRLLSKGDVDGAVKVGHRVLEAISEAKPGLTALQSVEKRAKAIEDSSALAVYKLKAIAESSGAKDPSPFLYTVPSPKQMLKQVQDLCDPASVGYEGLDDIEADCMRAYMAALLSKADTAVVDAYLGTVTTSLDDRAHSKSRAYLVAYVAGTHGRESYPSVLALLEKKAAGQVPPAAVVEDAMTRLGSATAAWAVFEAVDAAKGWNETERLRLLMLIAEGAKKGGAYERAARAYGVLALLEGAAGEEAQRVVIKMYAEDARDFKKAAVECEVYLLRFPGQTKAVEVEFLKTLYEYQAGEYDLAYAEVQAFLEKHPNANAVPNAMLLKGLLQMGFGTNDEAVLTLDALIREHAEHTLAGKALFLTGSIHLSERHIEQALDSFRRLTDFYPEDSYVPKAREYLEKYKILPLSQDST